MDASNEKHPGSCACEARKPTPPNLSPEGKAVFRAFASLSLVERGRIIQDFCECGSANLNCQCWNDE